MNELEKLLVGVIGGIIVILSWCFPMFGIIFVSMSIGYFVFRKGMK